PARAAIHDRQSGESFDACKIWRLSRKANYRSTAWATHAHTKIKKRQTLVGQASAPCKRQILHAKYNYPYLSVWRYRWIASTSTLLGATPLSVLKVLVPQCGIGDLSGFPSSSMPFSTARSNSSLFHSLASPTSFGPVSPLPFCP